MANNPLLRTDSYKHSHFELYPPNMTKMTSYIEARIGGMTHVRFFGLQGFIKKYLLGPRIHGADVGEATALLQDHGEPFDIPGFVRIVTEHNGRLPLRISALPEGLVVPAGIPLVKIESTDPNLAHLAQWVETQLIRAIWYPTTTASLSWDNRCVLKHHYEFTGASMAALDFALHDFGARGVSSGESAGLGGAGHLLNFRGTDTLEALEFLRDHYHEPCAGYSVPAAEHSTIMAWGRQREREFYEYCIRKYGTRPGIFSLVIDTYDQDGTLDLFCNELKPLVMETFGKTPGAKLVLRFDSGDPVVNAVTGPQRLGAAYGWLDKNATFLKLPDYIGVLQGDGITREMLPQIMGMLTLNGLRADNVVFGSGGGLLQRVTRDDARFAQKVCQVTVDGETFDVKKEPKSDPTKASKAGDVAVFKNGMGSYQATTTDQLAAFGAQNLLRPVYENGNLLVDEDLATIRARA